ncbi:MAG TPA: PRC-barrel domain-containing protein [Clostridia bacterium]
MESLRGILNKPLINIQNGKMHYIKNAVFDSSMSYIQLLVLTDKFSVGKEYVIKISDIKAVGPDALVANGPVMDSETFKGNIYQLLGADIYNQVGVKLGVLKDIYLNDFKVSYILMNESEMIYPSNIISSGNRLLITDIPQKLQVKKNLAETQHQNPDYQIEAQE